jgi:NSS family neurotransmitter:Na+ symporter
MSSPTFSSRLGLILSMLGIAVGTGNIWRFPRIAAQNSGDEGAGAFLVAWVVCLLVWSVPLIIAEYALGRKGGMGVIGTFARVGGEGKAWMGAFVGFVATAIMFYYSVVTGWCVFYLMQAVLQPLPQSTEAAMVIWEGFQGSAWPVLFHAVAMLLGGWAVWRGVQSIERVNKVLMPTLLGIVVLSLLRTVFFQPGSSTGIAFLFTPQWETLVQPKLWLEALTQNAWDTGAGWGLILTYAAYMGHREAIVRNSFITGVGNNMVSMMAAIIIFGTVFAILGQGMPKAEVLEVMKQSGPASTGLTFIWIPQLFARMPLGNLFAILFFLGLSFAAFTSLISMIELAVRALCDLGFTRSRAIVLTGSVGFMLGLPSAFNLTFFQNQDFVWGIGLMISGGLVAYLVLHYGVSRFRQEVVDAVPGDWRAGRGWELLIGVLVPVQVVALLAWWFYLSATEYAPQTWFNPLDPYSVMTCLVQWGLVAAIFLVLNRWLARKTLEHAG